MPTERLQEVLRVWLDERAESGASKAAERVIVDVVPPRGDNGRRFLLQGFGSREFIRMNANDYLGLAFESAVSQADGETVDHYGTGPGAVRFISGTWQPHRTLESRLAEFHNREAAMLFSSAYATVMGVLPALITDETAVLSDELNHNCIINAIRLARPRHKWVYPHLDLAALEESLTQAAEACNRAVIVTDGVFSMRGDHAPLDQIVTLARRYDHAFAENVIVIVDDSHGVGAYGSSGRGTEQVCGGEPVDLLISTLGKAIGVNGGYVVASETMIQYLREISPFYIYSNPIGPGEAAAAVAAVDVIDSEAGLWRLNHLSALSRRFKTRLTALGYDTVAGEHPIVAMLVRDTTKMRSMVDHLLTHNILVTGLGYPVVPAGEEEIRFQICADHTIADIEHVLTVVNSHN